MPANGTNTSALKMFSRRAARASALFTKRLVSKYLTPKLLFKAICIYVNFYRTWCGQRAEHWRGSRWVNNIFQNKYLVWQQDNYKIEWNGVLDRWLASMDRQLQSARRNLDIWSSLFLAVRNFLNISWNSTVYFEMSVIRTGWKLLGFGHRLCQLFLRLCLRSSWSFRPGIRLATDSWSSYFARNQGTYCI